MPRFDIVKKSEPSRSFRVATIMGDFDVQDFHATEHFDGDIDLPDNWKIGLIVGNSGTGKSSIAAELFHDSLCHGFEYSGKSVVDDMPDSASMNEIEQMFYSVGFGSVPSWLKPYSVLSNGEKMRVDLARALLERDFVVFDEFTSVVDRNVAQTLCIAVRKALERYPGKKFIAVTCHHDVQEWLQPDWVFSTDDMKQSFPYAHVPKDGLKSGNVGMMNGTSLGDITI